MKRITVVQGHPDPHGGHFCHALADAYAAGANEAGHQIVMVDVAKLDFPLARSRAELETGPTPAAIYQTQQVLRRADHLVLIFPVWNGGEPALLKGFLEQTFRPSFVFPDAARDRPPGFLSALFQRKALAGKSGRIVATMQMPAFVYRWYFHPHLEKNTLRLSGIAPVRETRIGLIEASHDRRRQRWLAKMLALGRRAA